MDDASTAHTGHKESIVDGHKQTVNLLPGGTDKQGFLKGSLKQQHFDTPAGMTSYRPQDCRANDFSCSLLINKHMRKN